MNSATLTVNNTLENTIESNTINHESLANKTLRSVKESQFKTHDGIDLFYRHWPAATEKTKGAIVLFHRGHEHSGRMSHIVDELDMQDYDCFAWDARGHGRSPGERGFSPSLATSVRDIQTFVQHICTQYDFQEEDMAVIAQSVGAVLVSTWVHDYAPKIRSMILASPAFKVKLYVPFARTGIKLMQAIRGHFYVNSYVKAKFLTHDPERIASFESDPLISRAISSNILTSLYDSADRVIEDAAAISVPTQLLISGSDWVVHQKPQHTFYEHLGSSIKERHVLKGFYHDTLGELDRKIAIDKARDFLVKQFASPVTRKNRLYADKSGFTRIESDELETPLSTFSFRGMYWAMTRLSIKVAGHISKGVKLGHETGFDSGSTLDYVYENKPKGLSTIGKIVDKNYLNSIGWRGIRQRKLNIESLLHTASKDLRTQGRPVDIMDVASGHGRYVLEAIDDNQQKPDSILLRDYSELNVQQGSQLIKSKGLDHIVRFINANAFDASTYDQPVTLGVVSGLYELFGDNELIRESLTGFASAIQPGGYLIYTNQPWHPQLEMIARALTSHRKGEAWVMRRRSQEEMDQLVASAGFTKIEQRIDEDGIFTVSLAQRS